MFYVLEGTLTLRLGDRTIKAGPGSLACVPPSVGSGSLRLEHALEDPRGLRAKARKHPTATMPEEDRRHDRERPRRGPRGVLRGGHG